MSWKLVLDANVYLNLAKVPGNAPVLRAIEKAVKRGDFNLLVPAPVSAAVHRNRDKAIQDFWKIRRDALRTMKSHLRDLADDPAAFDALATAINEAIEENTRELPDTVGAMDSLLACGVVVPSEDRHWADAGRRFTEKRPPAHERANKKREHIAILNDCLIWARVREEVDGEEGLEFVSGDSDFCSPTHNLKLHDDLAAEVDAARFRFHTLEDFIEKHVTNETRVSIVLPPPSYPWPSFTQCPVCGSDTILPNAAPGPTPYGWGYRQFCPAHGGYVPTGEPYDD